MSVLPVPFGKLTWRVHGPNLKDFPASHVRAIIAICPVTISTFSFHHCGVAEIQRAVNTTLLCREASRYDRTEVSKCLQDRPLPVISRVIAPLIGLIGYKL